MIGATSKVIFFEKEVNEMSMAYFNIPPVRLTLGTRVIAIVKSYNANPSKFIAGVIAEPTSPNNKFR